VKTVLAVLLGTLTMQVMLPDSHVPMQPDFRRLHVHRRLVGDHLSSLDIERHSA
jgi:hypothetical protein